MKTDEEGGLDFGSVVVIFDQDERSCKYPFQMTWLGEHSQESDMAFYSTSPGAEMVGPGISRMEHGGFMMSYPPLRMFDIWIDPSFDFRAHSARTSAGRGNCLFGKARCGLRGQEAAPDEMEETRQKHGKTNHLYSSGFLNPLHVKRMRTFHMLQNKGLRNTAHEFLKKD